MILAAVWAVKLKFHRTDMDTFIDFLARTWRGSRRAQKSACCGAHWPVQLADKVRGLVRRALFLARMSVGDTHVYTCTCTVQYVHIYKSAR